VVLSSGLLLEVDGTLVDTAFLHTLARQRACALPGEGVEREFGDALHEAGALGDQWLMVPSTFPTLTRPTSPMSTAAKAWLTNG
jgi:beta-phosphoglucomutase-like phosphatase (HAD superfamily)